jgi:hypothetical protein
MLSSRDRKAFARDGYLRFDGVLTPAEVQQLRAVIEAQGLPTPGEDVMDQRFGGASSLLAWDPAMVALLDHPVVVDVLREFIGPFARLDHAYGIMMRPGTSGLGVHGPAQPFDASQYYVERDGAIRSGLLSCAWSLTDGRPSDGGFGCVPGSHRKRRPHDIVEVPQPLGSLLVFTEALTHCTIPWRGAQDRYVLMYKYSPGNSAWDPSYPSARALTGCTERQARLLQPPSVGGRQPAL